MIICKHKFLNESTEITTNRSGREHTWRRPDGSKVNMKVVDRCIDIAIKNIANNLTPIYTILRQKDIFYTDHYKINTMATDGRSIFVNPSWVENAISRLGIEKASLGMEFVLIHEALHILFNHTYETDDSVLKSYDYDFDRINNAQDYEVNYYIENVLAPSDDPDAYKGVTEMMNGLYDEKYAYMVWQSIINSIPSSKNDIEIEKTSKKWKDGFKDGLLGTIQHMKKEGLIERYAIE